MPRSFYNVFNIPTSSRGCSADSEILQVVQFEFREIVGTIELEIAAKQTRWSEIWRGKGNKWRMFIMIWFGICSTCNSSQEISNQA